MMLSSSDSILLVEKKKHGGFDVQSAPSRADLVRSILDNGAIADGCHASDAHRQVLKDVIAYANQLLATWAERDRAQAEELER